MVLVVELYPPPTKILIEVLMLPEPEIIVSPWENKTDVWLRSAVSKLAMFDEKNTLARTSEPLNTECRAQFASTSFISCIYDKHMPLPAPFPKTSVSLHSHETATP